MTDNVVYERNVSQCIKIGYLQKIYKHFLIPHPLPWVRNCCALYSKWKVGASASVCRVTLCVYCWVNFVTIANMYGNLFSGHPRGLSLGLEKSLVYITAIHQQTNVQSVNSPIGQLTNYNTTQTRKFDNSLKCLTEIWSLQIIALASNCDFKNSRSASWLVCE